MNCTVLPLTADPRQILTLSPVIDGESLRARIEVRCLTSPGCWVLSLWNDASGELLVNQIPVVCSYGCVNDLLLPFRHLRNGAGIGSLFCLRNTDAPSTPDPANGNLTEFMILFGDIYEQQF